MNVTYKNREVKQLINSICAFMTKQNLNNKCCGAIIGSAIGDALGRVTEFLNSEQIKRNFGEQGIADLPEEALYTDDTEMMLKVLEVLVSHFSDSPAEIIENIALNFIVWFTETTPGRSPGATCLKACSNLVLNKLWFQSGLKESKGCGANMRVAPVGLAYFNNPKMLTFLSINQAAITHMHPTALVASEVTALAVSWALQDVPCDGFVKNIFSYFDEITRNTADYMKQVNLDRPEPLSWELLEKGWDELLIAIEKVEESLEISPFEIHNILGEGWVAEEALANALYCVMRSPDNFSEVVLAAANNSGDSDSVGAIAGAIIGARSIRNTVSILGNK